MNSGVARFFATIACAGALSANACDRDATNPSLSRSTGSIRVVVSLTGFDLPTRYVVYTSGRSTTPGADGVALLTEITPGTQLVTLQLTSNCRVNGENPQTVVVVVGQTTTVSFSATCQATTGSLRVTALTTGADLDPNGFDVQVFGPPVGAGRYQQSRAVAPNGSVLLSAVPVGNTTVALSGVAANCEVDGEGTRVVFVEPSKENTMTFAVRCAPSGLIAFARASQTGQWSLYVVSENGSGLRRISPEGSSDQDPAWSGDGTRLAFTSNRDGNREIYVADSDGLNPRRLTNALSEDYQPAWSPDGGKIAFVSERAGIGTAEIFVMNNDGTNVVRLTISGTREGDPAWSPDGKRIAYTHDLLGKPEVYVMSADGSSPTRVTTDGGKQPAWARDGTRLAYATPRYCSPSVYGCYPTIMLKAGDQAPYPLNSAIGERPSWSPDGSKVAYVGHDCDYYFVHCAAAGIRIARLTTPERIELAFGLSPAWRP